jgi:signal transduction histidine kinase
VRRRLLASTVLVALAAVLVLGIPLAFVEAHRERADAEAQLEREADGVAAAVEDRIEAHRPLDTAALRRRLPPAHAALIAPAGRPVVRVGPPVRGERISATSALGGAARVTAIAPAAEVDARVHRRWVVIALLSAGGIVAAVLLGLFQARRLSEPLEDLVRASALLGAGDFSARAGRSSIREIDAVAVVLDATAVRIARLIGREREFAANAAHQLRTPLTGLRLRLEEIETRSGEDAVREEAGRALHEVDRLQATITDLLAVAGDGRAGGAGRLELAALVEAHARRWRPLYARAGRELRVQPSAECHATASPGAIGQALDVLVENALRHGAGPVTVAVGERDGRPVISVDDEGPGVAPGSERSVFERGESADGGTGVGLHLARMLVEAEHGRLRIAPGRPARFEIALPSDDAPT